MIRFPNLIEWMDDMTMDELHNLHQVHQAVVKTESFSDFVQNEYDAHKETWEDEMNQHRPIRFSINEEKDICDELAKEVLATILSKGTKELKHIIDKFDLAPDYTSASQIVDSFWFKIIPAIEKTLKEIE